MTAQPLTTVTVAWRGAQLIPRNELTVIPPAIRHLATLAYLDVSNNR